MHSSRLAAWISVCIAVAGCSSNSTSTSTSGVDRSTETSDAKPRIALIMKSLANEFFSTMAAGAEAHQREHAGDYSLVSNGIKDERDVSRQVALVDEMVVSGVDAIVIAPADSKALVPVLRRAVAAGVVVINIDNRLDAEILKAENLAIPFVGPDNRSGAKNVGEFLAKKLSPDDEVLVLEGIRTSFNGSERRLGFEAAMNEAGIRIVDSQSAQWEMSKANTVASAMLSEHPGVKAILAANDNMALGAIAAAKSAGRADDLHIVGFDNIAAVQQAIRDGKVLATADQHGDQLAVYGIEMALKILAEPGVEMRDSETPIDVVTAETLGVNR